MRYHGILCGSMRYHGILCGSMRFYDVCDELGP
jgi:hypothetical protein